MCGVIYITKEDFTDLGSEVDPYDVLRADVETYSQYVSGDVWGFVIEDAEGEEVDSCWGIYGMGSCKEEARAFAKARLLTLTNRASSK
jgi:hypothetical protein